MNKKELKKIKDMTLEGAIEYVRLEYGIEAGIYQYIKTKLENMRAGLFFNINYAKVKLEEEKGANYFLLDMYLVPIYTVDDIISYLAYKYDIDIKSIEEI